MLTTFISSLFFLSEEEFQKVLVDLRRFLDELLAFGLDLNMDKTVVLLNMKGGRAPKWRKKVLRKEGDVTKLKLDAPVRPNPPLLLRLVKEHKYLGIMLSYDHCQDRTWILRKNAASATFARLRKWWGTTFPLHQQARLWFQTVWLLLSMDYKKLVLVPRGVQRFHGFVMRHLRILARSPRGADCETNISLLSRLKIIDPKLARIAGRR